MCRSIGFLGYIRLQVKEHTVIESHPDSVNLDLRLTNPWPELENHLKKIDISKLDNKERSHVPAIVILYYFISKFKEQNNGKIIQFLFLLIEILNFNFLLGALPTSREDKNKIRRLIRESAVSDENGIKTLEENFEEAIRFVNTCITNQSIPSQVKDILDDDSCINLTQKSQPFWIMCTALKEFVKTENLPVKGSLPDMASDSESYISLQQIYQKKAQAQAEDIYRRSCQIARNLGMHQDYISEQEVNILYELRQEIDEQKRSNK